MTMRAIPGEVDIGLQQEGSKITIEIDVNNVALATEIRQKLAAQLEFGTLTLELTFDPKKSETEYEH